METGSNRSWERLIFCDSNKVFSSNRVVDPITSSKHMYFCRISKEAKTLIVSNCKKQLDHEISKEENRTIIKDEVEASSSVITSNVPRRRSNVGRLVDVDDD